MSRSSADETSARELSRVVATKRFADDGLPTFLVWLYMPVGLCLSIIRIFIVLHVYVISVILSRLPTARRYVSRAVSVVLGFVATENKPQPVAGSSTDSTADTAHTGNCARQGRTLVVSNHISPFDFLAVESVFLDSVNAVKVSTLLTPDHSLFHWFANCIPNERSSSAQSTIWQRNRCAAFFAVPERIATNGSAGVLRFDESIFNDFIAGGQTDEGSLIVQPVAIRSWRPFPFSSMSLHVHGASRWADLFWSLASPFTVFSITVLPPIEVSRDTVSTSALAKRSAEAIASELKVRALEYSHSDVARILQPAPSPQPSSSSRSSSVTSPAATSTSTSRKRARQSDFDEIKSILPNVQDHRIWSLLNNNDSVEQILALLLEDPQATEPAPAVPTKASSASGAQTAEDGNRGKQKFTFGDSRFGKKPQDRQMSFEQRKRLLIDAARQKYTEKHFGRPQ